MTKIEYESVGRRADGSLLLRTRLLHHLARALNVQIKIGGWPYGADYRTSINGRALEADSYPRCKGQ
jgi:hypothetical protein